MSELDPWSTERGLNYWPNGVTVHLKEWSMPATSWQCHHCGIGAWEDWDNPDPNWDLLNGLTGAREHDCLRP